MWTPLSARRANLILHFTQRRGRHEIVDRGGYETRNAATVHLLVEALARAKSELAQSFCLPIFTDDFVRKPPATAHFAYCADDCHTNTVAMPDFLFWNWPQVGVDDYEMTVESILAAGEREPDDPRLFWTGNAATHPTRARFLEIAAGDPRIHGVGMNWIHTSPSAVTGRMQTINSQYVTLAEHCHFRYLIDLQGRGYSARVKLLLFSGRPLFLQARRWKEFFYADLVPMRHYIPVCEDLSDLGSMLDWAQTHPLEARQIADNARQYAVTHLRRRHAIDMLARQLVRLAGGQRDQERIASGQTLQV
jgi:hypothetical protein